MVDYDLIIIGCGPAGMNACLYATRAGLKTLVIEKNCPGGKVVKANVIENWLGIEKTNGVELSLQMFKHAFSYGGVYEQGNVLDVVNKGSYKEVVLKNKVYKCHAVIIATGTSEKKIGIIGEDKFYGKGVSYCAVCDASLYKNKPIAVIGNSQYALEETLYLSKFASKIYLINEKDAFDADENLIKLVQENKLIEIKFKSKAIEIKGKEVVDGLVIDYVEGQQVITVAAVFPFLGEEPDTKFINRLNILDSKGRIIVNDKKETDTDGIYAAGDCTTTSLKQIITASSDGALSAMTAYKYIKNKKGRSED